MSKIKLLNAQLPKSNTKIPLVEVGVSAGFPSPANDFIEKTLDLNQLLIKHPAATFFARVVGESMKDVGIYTDDILIIDRSLDPRDEDIVIALIDGEFTVKRVKKIKSELYLVPENSKFEKIKITEEDGFMVWGVVTGTIKSFR
jgi:DNA polymerase V